MSDNLMVDTSSSKKNLPIIEIRGLHTRFGDTVIHNGIDLDVNAGQILGLVGGVRVYSKFSSGDPDASKSATALFLSCVFLVIVGTVLRSFFL